MTKGRDIVREFNQCPWSTEVEGRNCVDMLLLCGERGGMAPWETPSQYLRRLLDDLTNRADGEDQSR